MKAMFTHCIKIKYLPDISNLDTSNVTDMSYLFNDCISLTSLPDISKWDIKNVKDMRGLFASCYEIKNLPDISNWNMENVSDISLELRKIEISNEKQLLLFNGKKLENDKNLSDYNITKESLINLEIIPMNELPLTKIRIKYHFFKNLEIEVKPSDLIFEVKLKIKEKEKIPVEAQKLYDVLNIPEDFNILQKLNQDYDRLKVIYQNDKILLDYGINNKSLLYLVDDMNKRIFRFSIYIKNILDKIIYSEIYVENSSLINQRY